MAAAADQLVRAGQPLHGGTLPAGSGRALTGPGAEPVASRHGVLPARSARRGEHLEGDVVGVAERQARAVAGVEDLAVGDAELVEALRPLLQLGPGGDAEGDVVEPGGP